MIAELGRSKQVVATELMKETNLDPSRRAEAAYRCYP